MCMTLRRWIRLTLICYLGTSVLGCQGIPKPVGHVGVIHVKEVNAPYINEFDMQSDFDDDLHVLPGHSGVHRQLSSLADLDRGVWMAAASYANALAAYAKLKQRYQQCIEGN